MRRFAAAEPSPEHLRVPEVRQKKLSFGQRGDAWEQEAERVASGALRRPAVVGATTMAPVEPTSSGASLPDRTRSAMEARFGHDFSRVRVHREDATAASLGARALTVGRDIFFAPGHFEPGSAVGQRLIAHELTHVLQQGAQASRVQLAEVDSGAPDVKCDTLPESGPSLNRMVNASLAVARADAEKSNPVGRGKSIDPFRMVTRAYYLLGRPVLTAFCPIELLAMAVLKGRGGGVGMNPAAGTKYENVTTYNPYFHMLAPTVKLNGVCAGTDKIGHMFQQGFQYFFIAASAQKGRVDSSLGEKRATAWGEYIEGRVSPATKNDPATMTWLKLQAKEKPNIFQTTGQSFGYFGLARTGVVSRADLAANAAGLRFYQDLFANPKMRFDIANYITPNWNEEVAGNIYRRDIGEAVAKAGRLNPHDVVLK
jgi:Domain of unknown function (DUF4157)